jgi:hypothetical protein
VTARRVTQPVLPPRPSGIHYEDCWRDHLACAAEYVAFLRVEVAEERRLRAAVEKRLDDERRRVESYWSRYARLLVENDRLRGITAWPASSEAHKPRSGHGS